MYNFRTYYLPGPRFFCRHPHLLLCPGRVAFHLNTSGQYQYSVFLLEAAAFQVGGLIVVRWSALYLQQ